MRDVAPARADLPNVAVMVSGRGSNLAALIAAEESDRLGAHVALVVSDRADAPALEHARAAGRKTHVVEPGPSKSRLSADAEGALVRLFSQEEIALVALAGFMRIVGPTLIGAFPNRLVNIHPSLLPAFPGLDAQRQACEYGARYAGCTVHLVNEMIDAGPVILQAVVRVLPTDTEALLAERILEQEHILYPKAIRLLAEGRVRIDGRRVTIDESGADWL